MNPFFRFFVDPEDIATEAEILEAQEIVAWASMPYFKKYLANLEKEARKPLLIGDHMDMVKAAVQGNTIRAMIESLTLKVKYANDTATRMRENPDA